MRADSSALVIASKRSRHRDDAVLLEVAREDGDDGIAQLVVVGLLRVEADRAVVADAELRGAEALEPEEAVEVVGERADGRPRLAEPERGLTSARTPDAAIAS